MWSGTQQHCYSESSQPVMVGRGNPDTGVLNSRTPAKRARLGAALHSVQSARRIQVESYIAGHYARVYGACINDFLPLLLEFVLGNTPVGALGMCPAECGPLFLEQYIDQSVEQCVANHLQRPVSRGSMIEIGNLVATGKGCSPLLFALLVNALLRANYQWMVFTATPQVKKLIGRLNYQPDVLGLADPARLGEGAGKWGSYYQSKPSIMLVDIPRGAEAISSVSVMNPVFQEYRGVAESLAVQLRDHRRLCGGRHES